MLLVGGVYLALTQVVVQADETPLNVLKEEKQYYMWLY
jgi:transposase